MSGIFDIKKIFDPLGLFTKDKAPSAPTVEAPTAPANDAAAAAERDLQADNARLRAAAGGRASTFLTSASDDDGSKTSARKLLGG